MNKDERKNYATYFKVGMYGNGHTPEFRNKTYILRAGMNESAFWVEEELQRVYELDLKMAYDTSNFDLEAAKASNLKHVLIQRVEPFTTKELEELSCWELIDDQLVFDEEDRKLVDKIQNMPIKL